MVENQRKTPSPRVFSFEVMWMVPSEGIVAGSAMVSVQFSCWKLLGAG